MSQPHDQDPRTRLAHEVHAHQSGGPLGALAFDVLSRQAEGKVLFSGREFVQKRAQEHGVASDEAKTTVGNLLAVLERGAESDSERRMVAAFALRGLDAGLQACTNEAAEAQLASRFARHAEWLELATPYAILDLIDALLSEEHAALVHRELAQAVVDDARGEAGERPAARALNAARLSALSHSDAGRSRLADVIDTAGLDAPTRALATALGGVSRGGDTETIRGRAAAPLARGLRAAMRWLTGWAILSWLGRGAALLTGHRRELELALVERGVEIHEERWILGRKVGDRRATVALSSLVSAAREVRFPSLHLVIGAASLTFGLLLGGLLIFDGVRSGELVLALIGAGLAFGGAALDLALDVLVPGARGRVRLELAAHRGKVVTLADVPVEAADRFLDAIRARTK